MSYHACQNTWDTLDNKGFADLNSGWDEVMRQYAQDPDSANVFEQ